MTSRPTDRQWNYYVDLCARYKIAPLARDTLTFTSIGKAIDRMAAQANSRVSSHRSRRQQRNTFGYRRGTMH